MAFSQIWMITDMVDKLSFEVLLTVLWRGEYKKKSIILKFIKTCETDKNSGKEILKILKLKYNLF